MAYPAGTPFSGTRGRVQLNAVNLALDHWDVDSNVDLDDTTSFEDYAVDGNTYQVDVPGIFRATGTIGGYWNSARNPYVSDLVVPGALLTNLFLYVDRIGNVKWSFSAVRITGTPQSVDVGGGKIKFSCKFKSYGPYQEPGYVAAAL